MRMTHLSHLNRWLPIVLGFFVTMPVFACERTPESVSESSSGLGSKNTLVAQDPVTQDEKKSEDTQEEKRKVDQDDAKSEPTKSPSATDKTAPPDINEDDLVRLSPDHKVWYDRKAKIVVVDGEVCLRQGQLEVFACPQGTKEHESVVKVFSPAFLVHAGLLRVGAIPGKTVQFDPEYQAAEGMVVDVWVYWKNDKGELQKTRAQEWVRHAETKKELTDNWVFGGSGFWVDEETGERFYQAEGGELICVSNFSTATMDLPIESSQSNAALLFEPFTERIPNRGTAVRLVLKPRLQEKEAAKTDGAPDGAQPPGDDKGGDDKGGDDKDGGGKPAQGDGKIKDLIG